MANYDKTIVVDLDDTLSYTTDRNWEYATPNLPLINRLKELHKQDWIIDIVTARGQLSTTGALQAEVKYRKQIEKWLEIHEVPYNSLSFKKLLARYYIDDKGITPEDFLKLNIGELTRTKEITEGQSGARLTYDSDFVYKEYPSFDQAQEFIKWTEATIHLNLHELYIPEVVSLIGTTVKMKKIPFNNADTYHLIDKAIEVLELFKISKAMIDNQADKYVEGIIKHMFEINNSSIMGEGSQKRMMKFNNIFNEIQDPLYSNVIPILSKWHTFNHGDFSLDNFLLCGDLLYLIDPIFNTEKYQSVLIDIAKLGFSLYRQSMIKNVLGKKPNTLNPDDGIIHLYKLIDLWEIPRFSIHILMISEGLRTLKYSTPENFDISLDTMEFICFQGNRLHSDSASAKIN